jgi:hypothetical protein
MVQVPRKWFAILIISLFLTVLAACQPQAPERAPSPSMKGIELYSWQTAAGEWRYALLPGTNRQKTYDEVVANPLTQEELEKEMAYLVEGEMVFWINWVDGDGRELLSFPPEEVIAGLVAYAEDLEIELEVFDP